MENFLVLMPINFVSCEVKGIIPIAELCKIALRGIVGNSVNDFIGTEIITNDNNFGVIGDLYGERVGFTLNIEEKYKKFELSVGDAKDLMIDQLQLFDQVRAWGFTI
jgi:hypothetical protein